VKPPAAYGRSTLFGKGLLRPQEVELLQHHLSNPRLLDKSPPLRSDAGKVKVTDASVSESTEGVLVLVLRMMVDNLLYTRNLVEAGKPTAEILTAIDSVTTNLRTAGEVLTR
jgi:hypothetical protein